MTQKTNVFLDTTEGKDRKGRDIELIPIELGRLTNAEITGYNYKLTNLHKIPDDSCISELSITKCDKQKTTITKEFSDNELNTSSSCELNLRIIPQHTNKNCLASNGAQCLCFITGGKCKDPFVIENIGKKFFPSLYEKQH